MPKMKSSRTPWNDSSIQYIGIYTIRPRLTSHQSKTTQKKPRHQQQTISTHPLAIAIYISTDCPKGLLCAISLNSTFLLVAVRFGGYGVRFHVPMKFMRKAVAQWFGGGCASGELLDLLFENISFRVESARLRDQLRLAVVGSGHEFARLCESCAVSSCRASLMLMQEKQPCLDLVPTCLFPASKWHTK